LACSSKISRFFLINYLNNHIFNDKSGKIKILKIRMAACHCEWRFANAPLAVASLIFFLIFSYFMEKKNITAPVAVARSPTDAPHLPLMYNLFNRMKIFKKIYMKDAIGH
jgi:hypothetical protein